MLTREHLTTAVHIGLEGECAPEDCDAVVDAVLDAIIANTDSPRTVDELARLRTKQD